MKNRGIWIAIALILVLGIGVTAYTSRVTGQAGALASQSLADGYTSGQSMARNLYGQAYYEEEFLPEAGTGAAEAEAEEERPAEDEENTVERLAAAESAAGAAPGSAAAAGVMPAAEMPVPQADAPAAGAGQAAGTTEDTGSTGAAPAAESAAGSGAGDFLSAGPGAAADLSGDAGAPAVTPASPDSQDVASGQGKTGSGSRSRSAKSRSGRTAGTSVRSASAQDQDAASEETSGEEAGTGDSGTAAGPENQPAALAAEITESPAADESTAAASRSRQQRSAPVVISPLSGSLESLEGETEENRVTSAELEERLKKLDAKIAKARDEEVDSSTSAVLAAYSNELRMWESELNLIYTSILDVLTEEEAQKLKDDEKTWLRTREKTSQEAAAQYSGGTMETVEYTASMSTLTRERAYALLDTYGEELDG